ncbi:unnamed protein product [Dimorphilus gyrociliatus]|uniref:Uncharacterized protein n=1 Tax=Dimorphilus gyrociliatus TaxID=2664684 RepID=A0A7I8VYT6_9ANNE|nr:unnamed protein product [Dimorphilus gyrociliatus]
MGIDNESGDNKEYNEPVQASNMEIDTDNENASSNDIENCINHTDNIEEDSFEIYDTITPAEPGKTFQLVIGESQKGNDILLHNGFAFNRKGKEWHYNNVEMFS